MYPINDNNTIGYCRYIPCNVDHFIAVPLDQIPHQVLQHINNTYTSVVTDIPASCWITSLLASTGPASLYAIIVKV